MIQVEITTTEVGTVEQVTTLVEVAGAGPQGAKGDTGATGAVGPGVPDGGTTGQVLAKASNADQDTEWSSDYATAAQGGLADTAIQPGDDVSDLTNDANYIDASGAPVQSVASKTGNVTLVASDVGLGNVPNLDTTDAVNKAHNQNTDIALSFGTVNEVSAAEARSHIDATNNPHSVTKTQVGLGNVDNVSAADLRDRSTHTGTQAATTVTYDNTTSGLTATNLKDAIDEIAAILENVLRTE